MLKRQVMQITTALAALGFLAPAYAMSPRCEDLIGVKRGASELFSPNLDDHEIRSGDKVVLPLMNSEALVNYTLRGGEAKSGLAAGWSSPAALKQVLGLNGPLGPKGPLSMHYGVIGRTMMSASFWVETSFKFLEATPFGREWLNFFAQGEPIKSPFSPLRQFGPMFGNDNESAYNILGTAGFLGPLVLGPAGPLGGLQTAGLRGPDDNGNYTDVRTGKVADKIVIRSNGERREYRIFKYLKTSYARARSQTASLDTSFMVDDMLDRNQSKSVYQLTSPADQMISFLVVPPNSLATGGKQVNFNLTVRDQDENILLDSRSTDLVNFIQLQAPKGMRLNVEVTRQDSEPSSAPQNFRLMVVGDPFFDLRAEGALNTPQAMPQP